MKTVHYKGYTVLEVMLVISISAGMFVIVAVSFNGRQQQIQFTQAVRNFDSQLRDITNDVSSGYYAIPDNVVCKAVGNNVNRRPLPEIDTSETPELGTNEECVLIGKVIQFSPSGNSLDADNNQIMKLYNIVGLRDDGEGNNMRTLVESKPTAIPVPQEILLKWGLRVTNVVMEDGSVQDLAAISLFSALSRGGDLSLSETNENVNVSAVNGSIIDLSESDFIDIANSIARPSSTVTLNNNSSVTICVKDANSERKASIRFGGNISGTIIDFDNYNVTYCGV